MKCPECDAEQPDNASLCAKCGLSFFAWREANPESSKKVSVPEPEMTFPVPEEDRPDPEEEPAPEEKPAPAIAKPLQDSQTEEPPNTGSIEETIPGDKKGFKWTPLYSAGLGLFAALALAGFFFSHRSSKPTPNQAEGNILPIGTLTPTISFTPGTETPIASPQTTGTPENGLLLKTPTPLSETAPIKAQSAKPASTFTPTPESIIPPEEPSPTPTTKPASAPNSQNEGQALSAPISKEQKIGGPPTELPVSAIWADSPTPSSVTTSPISTADTAVPSTAASSTTPVSSPPAEVSTQAGPSDILESPEPKHSATPSPPPL